MLRKMLKSQSTVTTSLPLLDDILGGGIETGYITEVSGESGCGKTQFCFQLCINTQLPQQYGGLNAEVIFIDTEKTFSSERLIEMATVTLQEKDQLIGKLDVRSILSHIYVFQCIEAVELLAVIHQLSKFIEAHPKVRLIIIDSIAHAIRSEELTTRTRIMLKIATKLRQLTMHTNVGAVLVNQVTTRFNTNGSARIIPALGETWSYIPCVKILLKRQGAIRSASLIKSPTRSNGNAKYQISRMGVRDPNVVEPCFKHQQLHHHRHRKVTARSASLCVQLQDISQKCIQLSQQVIDHGDKHDDGHVTHELLNNYENNYSYKRRNISGDEEVRISKLFKGK